MGIKTLKQVLILNYSDLDFPDGTFRNLINHIFNDRQSNRETIDKNKDIVLEKLAEEAIISIFNMKGINYYHSYDSFRIDKFKNHAPFEGVFAQNIDADTIKFINQSVIEHGSKLSEETRDALYKSKIYTVDIKSTRISRKHRKMIDFISYEDPGSVSSLVELLLSFGFVSYPFHLRVADFSFPEYCRYVGRKLGLKDEGYELAKHIIELELQNAPDYYIRVFIDEDYGKIFVTGFITKEELLKSPKIIKLNKNNDGENAICFYKKSTEGHSLLSIDDFIDFSSDITAKKRP